MTIGNLKKILIGDPFPTSQEIHERLDKVRALAVFASDPISSNAYATEAIMSVLIVLGSGALSLTLPLGLAGCTSLGDSGGDLVRHRFDGLPEFQLACHRRFLHSSAL